jgi:hypothetical protein
VALVASGAETWTSKAGKVDWEPITDGGSGDTSERDAAGAAAVPSLSSHVEMAAVCDFWYSVKVLYPAVPEISHASPVKPLKHRHWGARADPSGH